jgi:hypothetical protein
MKLYETSEDYKLSLWDIETIKCYFLASFYNPDTEEWLEFEISEYKNDLYALIKFYHSSNIDFAVGYNNLGFDAQVLHFIVTNYEKWFDYTNLEICHTIYNFVQNLIENQSYGVRLPYYENQFTVNQLDCFTILGLNGEARFTSLKALQFRLRWHNVESMSIDHSTEYMSLEDIENVKSYCRNDILSTYEVFKLVLGDTDDELYKGKNQLQLRFDIKNEFNINCLNLSDIDLGDNLLKSEYSKVSKTPINQLPKKGTFRKYVFLKNCIPDYIKFNTLYLQNLLKDLKKSKINQNDSFEKKVKINGRIYTLAKGGLHADHSNEIFKADDDYIIEDDDVSSYYPAIVVNNQLKPAHLSDKLLKSYEHVYRERIRLKPLGKKDKKIQGIVEAYKLLLNSCFGKFGSMTSWLYDAQTMFSVTLTGELSLLMLIEMFEENGINVISANSDGVTTRFHKSKLELKNELVKQWQQLTNFEIETVRFKWFYYLGVNSYIACTDNNKYKFKNDFVSDVELYKNPSKRIIPLALQQYFINGVRPEEFIPNHKDILDFCIRAKSNKSTGLYLVYSNGIQEKTSSVLRYYLTTKDNAPELFKIGTGTKDNDINANQNAPNELGVQKIQTFNKIEEFDYQIDYQQYIYQTYRIIAKIEKNKKDLNYVDSILNKNQFKLF